MGDRLATIDMGQKEGAVVPLSEGGRAGPIYTQCRLGRELGPHLTMSSGPRSTSVPSDILIHPAVWP